jgi:tetratricopeptide (TPR) repeat protein
MSRTLLLSCILWGGLLSLLPAQTAFDTGTRSTAARQYLDLAQQYLDASDPRQAIDQLRLALRADPDYIDAIDLMGDSFRAMDKPDSAVRYYRRSIGLYPRNLWALQALSLTYHLKGEYQQAIDSYKDLQSQYPAYPEGYLGMARILFDLEQFREALPRAEQAMRLYLQGGENLRAADARMLAGRCYLAIGEPKRALRYFKASERHFETESFFPFYLGQAYLDMGKKEKALTYLLDAKSQGFQVPAYLMERARQP